MEEGQDGPAFAMDKMPALVCFSLKFSSANAIGTKIGGIIYNAGQRWWVTSPSNFSP
jgi:hypothetical protein